MLTRLIVPTYAVKSWSWAKGEDGVVELKVKARNIKLPGDVRWQDALTEIGETVKSKARNPFEFINRLQWGN